MEFEKSKAYDNAGSRVIIEHVVGLDLELLDLMLLSDECQLSRRWNYRRNSYMI